MCLRDLLCDTLTIINHTLLFYLFCFYVSSSLVPPKNSDAPDDVWH
jgi:hypothetical protein